MNSIFHWVFPHEDNGHKAHFLKPAALTVILLIFVLAQRGVTTIEPDILGYASQISPEEVIRLTNIKRKEANLSEVKENGLLTKAAMEKGKDMLAQGYWAHVAPDGTQPWDFFKEVGYKYRYAGENLARDFPSPSQVVDAWMASPSHRDNLLSERYREIGVAVVEGQLGGKEATIVVQMFGTLAQDRPQIPVAKAATKEAVPAVKEEVPQQTPEPVKVAETKTLNLVDTVQAQTQMTDVASPTFSISKSMSLVLIGFVLALLVFDGVITWKRGVVRKSARPLAQIAFLGMVAAIIIIAKAGRIL